MSHDEQNSVNSGAETTDETRDGWQNFRDYLAKNKIFFDTIAATLLTIMALVVSITQGWISSQQNRLLNIQIITERQQALPQFFVDKRTPINIETGVANDDIIRVYNYGNIAYDVNYERYVFFDIQVGTEYTSIPVSGYYSITEIANNATGLAFTFRGNDNNIRRSSLVNQLMDIAESQGTYAEFRVRRYIEISYTDVFGGIHIDFYHLPNIGSTEKLSETDRQQVIEEYSEPNFYFDDLTAEQLFELGS